jgi:hypothetical protein
VRRLRSPGALRLSKRDGSEEAQGERDEESGAAGSVDMTGFHPVSLSEGRHFAPGFAAGTGALGGAGATGGGGSGFSKLR